MVIYIKKPIIEKSSGSKWLEKVGWDERQVLEQPNPKNNIKKDIAKHYYCFSYRYNAAGIAKNSFYFHVISEIVLFLFFTWILW